MRPKNVMTFVFLLLASAVFANPYKAADKRAYYEIKVYRLATSEQVKQVDQFLQNDYLPALHRAGIGKIGVFHPTVNDTAAEKRVIVFIPLRSLDDLNTIEELILTDVRLKEANAYLDAAYNASPYKRIESIVLKAFPLMPSFQPPS
ncbi:MAG: family containing protein, partial [Sediminibacterium sp.]|nr:family containing protein [Sediminibacterium sp.]